MRVHRFVGSDGGTIAIGRCRGTVVWLVLGVVALGCSDSSPGITDPDHTTPPPFSAALASIDAGSSPIVFVSLPAGSIHNGTEAHIRVEATGSTLVAPIVDGGFDPVAMPAVAGDTITIEVQAAGGARMVVVPMIVKAKLPPVIVRTVPPKNKRDVPLNARIAIVFSKPVDPIVLSGTGVQLRTGGAAVTGRLEFTDATHTTVAFIPNAALAASTDYELLATQAIRDVEGLSLAEPVSVSFTTGTAPNQTARVSVSPSSVNLDQGESVPLVATVTDARGNTLAGQTVTWTSSDAGVARVAGNGMVTGVADGGPVLITATSDGVTNSASVTIFSKNTLAGMLVFVSERDGNPEIYLANADGTGLLRLTNNAAEDVDPAWSPDGERIAFVSNRDGRWNIFVMNADGSNVVQLTYSGSEFTPAWSPDGRKIAFSSVQGGVQGIHVLSLDGDLSTTTQIGPTHGSSPAWSPDGSKIAFVSNLGVDYLPSKLYVMNADGSGMTALIEGVAPGAHHTHYQPAWSPDGSKIAMIACPDTYFCDIALVNTDRPGLRTLESAVGEDPYDSDVWRRGFDVSPTWSPDGSTIAFSEWGTIRYARVDGSKRGLILPEGFSPAWRP